MALKCRRMQFLGVKLSGILPMVRSDDSFRPLTRDDRKLAVQIMGEAKLSGLASEGFGRIVKHEVALMLQTGLKAELEILEELKGSLTGWVSQRLITEVYYAREEVLMAPDAEAIFSCYASSREKRLLKRGWTMKNGITTCTKPPKYVMKRNDIPPNTGADE